MSTRPKGSFGEFFEVRAQVDRDLTTVSRVDRRLGLIKNLGHHRRAGQGEETAAARTTWCGERVPAFRRETIQRTPFDCHFFTIFELKCYKQCIQKL
jgi:hypothetical protein